MTTAKPKPNRFAKTTTPEPAAEPVKVADNRQGTTLRFPPVMHRRVTDLALDVTAERRAAGQKGRTTFNDLVIEALQLLFEKRGLPPLDPNK